MTTYERVTYRPEGESRSRTLILADPADTTFVGAPCISGVEVDVEGDEVAARGVDERRHIIEVALVRKRTPMRMNRYTGVLAPISTRLTDQQRTMLDLIATGRVSFAVPGPGYQPGPPVRRVARWMAHGERLDATQVRTVETLITRDLVYNPSSGETAKITPEGQALLTTERTT